MYKYADTTLESQALNATEAAVGGFKDSDRKHPTKKRICNLYPVKLVKQLNAFG
jgi:hypothetical protein